VSCAGPADREMAMKPGEYFLQDSDIIANKGREAVSLSVSNSGDRPVQVGSHFHFFEVNRALKFDRSKALGMRLNIPSGTAVRFEPGQTHTVSLIPVGGTGKINGFNRLVEGSVADEATRESALARAKAFSDAR